VSSPLTRVREQGTGNRKQETGNRGQGTGNDKRKDNDGDSGSSSEKDGLNTQRQIRGFFAALRMTS